MEALELLRRYADRERLRFYDRAERVPLDGVVPAAWREAVIDEQGRVERIPYELCVLAALRDALRRREIWVVGANRWRDPESDLPADFEHNRDVHYAAIRAPLDPTAFIDELRSRLDRALSGLSGAVRDDTAGGVRISTRRGQVWITVPRPSAQPEPANLQALKDEVLRRWGTIDLLDAFKEVEWLTGLTDEFSSIATRENLPREVLRRRLLLVLFALGTNMASGGSSPPASTARARLRCAACAVLTSPATICAARSFASSTPPSSGPTRAGGAPPPPARATPSSSAPGSPI